jgi:sugar O-acyltransferase (sialic acid O-acetyltransferase NeuD family)
MIHILGTGDLCGEFISFSNFDLGDIKTYSKSQIYGGDLKKNIDKNDKVFIAISDPAIRKRVFEYVLSLGLVPDTYIHSSVIMGLRTKVGIGCIIQPNAIISNDVLIKNAVFINCNTNIGHNVIIGDYCSLMVNISIGGHCHIEDGVLVGSGANVLPNIKVVSNTKIGIGSVVIRNVLKPGSYFGNPAKFIY